MNDATLARLTDMFWPAGARTTSHEVHWLLDGARDSTIWDIIRRGGLEYSCLFGGDLHPRLQTAAPYLVHLAPGSPTTDLLLRRGWGNAWGIVTVADPAVTLSQQTLHFKKLLRVTLEHGGQFGFRFYDPRVLNTYLPTCTGDELRPFFGPVRRLIAERPGGSMFYAFELGPGGLRSFDYAV